VVVGSRGSRGEYLAKVGLYVRICARTHAFMCEEQYTAFDVVFGFRDRNTTATYSLIKAPLIDC